MALRIVKLKPLPGLVLAGIFEGDSYYAQYNQHLKQALRQLRRYDFGYLPDHSPAALADTEGLGHIPKDLQQQIEHRAQPVIVPPDRGQWILMQPWEYGSIPQQWQATLQAADEIWVHTEQNRLNLLADGYEAERLFVLPPGIDNQYFERHRPRLQLPENLPAFRFVFVGELQWHSGLDILLEAYAAEFLADEPVSLVVSGRGTPGLQPASDLLQSLQNWPEDLEKPALLYLPQSLTEPERAALLNACQVMVHPCRADAFGFSPLEAAACSLPRIVTDQAGRFGLGDIPGTLWLNSRPVSQSEAQIAGVKTLRPPHWKEVSVLELRQAMRQAYANYQKLFRDADAGSLKVQQTFSWQAIGDLAVSRLQDLSTARVLRFEQLRWQTQALKGLEALETGQTEAALQHFTSVQTDLPDDPLMQLNIAGIHLQAKDYKAALQTLYPAINPQTTHANLFYAAGVALYELKAWSLAVMCFNKTLHLDPQHPRATESLALARAQAGKSGDTSTHTHWQAWQTLLQDISTTRPKPTLSLCMIVKDEALFLTHCLSSVQELVDEMIIVDTGSSDDTPQIATDFGARVFHHDWSNNFAEARNISLSHATGDWILIMDADEVLTPESLPLIRRVIEHASEQEDVGYMLKIRNLKQDENDLNAVEHYMFRLFPRRNHLRFTGLIHEQIASTDPAYTLTKKALADVLILHYGYSETLMQTRNKFERNRDLLLQSIKQQPTNPFHYFNLGLSYFSHQDTTEALESFQKAIQLSETLSVLPSYMAACHNYVLGILIEQNQLEAAKAALEKVPDLCFESPDFWMHQGNLHLALEAYDIAAEAYQKALSLRREHMSVIVSERGASSWKPYVGLGNVALATGKHAEADRCFRQALREHPTQPDILLGLARLARMRRQSESAQHYLERLEQLSLSEALQNKAALEYANLYLLQREFDKAEQSLLALLNNPAFSEAQHNDIRHALGQVYLETQRIPEALQYLQSDLSDAQRFEALVNYYYQQQDYSYLLQLCSEIIAQQDQLRAVAHLRRGAIYLLLGETQAAETDFKAALKANPGDAEATHNLGVLALQALDHETAAQYFEQALRLQPDLFESHLDLGKLLIYQEKHEQALPHLQAAHQSQPENIEGLELLGFAARATGQADLAGNYYMDILTLNPEHIDALIQLGYLLSEAGETGRALQLFQRALNTGEQSPALYNGIGFAFLDQERYEDARNAFFLSLRAMPDQPEIQRALALADQLSEQAPLPS